MGMYKGRPFFCCCCCSQTFFLFVRSLGGEVLKTILSCSQLLFVKAMSIPSISPCCNLPNPINSGLNSGQNSIPLAKYLCPSRVSNWCTVCCTPESWEIWPRYCALCHRGEEAIKMMLTRTAMENNECSIFFLFVFSIPHIINGLCMFADAHQRNKQAKAFLVGHS